MYSKTPTTASIVITANTAYFYSGGVYTLPGITYTLGTRFSFGIQIYSGTAKFFYNDMTKPVWSFPLVNPCDTNAWKVGRQMHRSY